jgi:hypothetical protein
MRILTTTIGFFIKLLRYSGAFRERELGLAGLTDSCPHTTQRRVVLEQFLFFLV